jgi:hypothetical protein
MKPMPPAVHPGRLLKRELTAPELRVNRLAVLERESAAEITRRV